MSSTLCQTDLFYCTGEYVDCSLVSQLTMHDMGNCSIKLYISRLFDREQKDSYIFDVFATDGGLYGPRSERQLVEIVIMDVNDNSPVFEQIPYTKEIPQNTPQGTSVLTVSIPPY